MQKLFLSKVIRALEQTPSPFQIPNEGNPLISPKEEAVLPGLFPREHHFSMENHAFGEIFPGDGINFEEFLAPWLPCRRSMDSNFFWGRHQDGGRFFLFFWDDIKCGYNKINYPFGNGLYQLIIYGDDWGMVYYGYSIRLYPHYQVSWCEHSDAIVLIHSHV